MGDIDAAGIDPNATHPYPHFFAEHVATPRLLAQRLRGTAYQSQCSRAAPLRNPMSLQNDLTTLVCLFHHQDHAEAATKDLLQAGIPQESITVIGGFGADADALDKSELAGLGMPDKDYDHLKSGLREGGVVVAVADTGDTATVEGIFHKHSADKIDETDKSYRDVSPLAAAAALPLLEEDAVAGERAIPVVEEEMVVGKRTVDAGGVRVFRRVVEIPVEESVQLREEHINVDRRPVDRLATDSDLAFGDRTIELTETAEEAVIGKSARVVEEVVVGKTTTERTETISGHRTAHRGRGRRGAFNRSLHDRHPPRLLAVICICVTNA